MGLLRVTPPAGGRTTTVAGGRTYVGVAGVSQDVPDADALTLGANGWLVSDTRAGSGSGGSFADLEVPAGAINGANTAYTLANTPSPAASLQLFRNGVLLTAGGVDYTLSGATITYAAAPLTGDTHVCSYRY